MQDDDDCYKVEPPSTDALLPQLSVSPVSIRPTSPRKQPRFDDEWGYKSFTIAICACARNHAPFYHQLPKSLVSTYADFDKLIVRLTKGHRTRAGVLTDLQGNDPYGIEEWYEDYLACHLPGLIWHSDFYHGVALGDRLAAQIRIRQCLSSSGSSTCYCTDENRDTSASAMDDHSRLSSVTPPPAVGAVPLTSSSRWTPWTATTNSSGRVTQLDSCHQAREQPEFEPISIYNESSTNVFDVESGDEGSVYIGGKRVRESRKSRVSGA